jgi:hypothetical protein
MWKHNKTGNLYTVLSSAIAVTNIRNGLKVIIYYDETQDLYVREEQEFLQNLQK